MGSKCKRIIVWGMLILSVVLYVAYIFSSVLRYPDATVMTGWDCITLGFEALEYSDKWYIFWSWMSNPVYVLGVVLLPVALYVRKPWLSWLCLLVCATSIGLTHCLYAPYSNGKMVELDVMLFDATILYGRHIWMFSMAFLVLANVADLLPSSFYEKRCTEKYRREIKK